MTVTIKLTCEQCKAEISYTDQKPPWREHDPRIGMNAAISVLSPGPRYVIDCPSCDALIYGAKAPDRTRLVRTSTDDTIRPA